MFDMSEIVTDINNIGYRIIQHLPIQYTYEIMQSYSAHKQDVSNALITRLS